MSQLNSRCLNWANVRKEVVGRCVDVGLLLFNGACVRDGGVVAISDSMNGA